MGEDATQNIRVAVRCRPLSKKELGNNETSIFSINSGNVQLKNPADGKAQSFNFDGIFPPGCAQHEIWDWLGQPLLDKCIEGFNGTVFAYGQTGSGKTWSMQGVPADEELRGLIPRFTIKLFERVEEEKAKDENKMFLITCSYFEIYNEVRLGEAGRGVKDRRSERRLDQQLLTRLPPLLRSRTHFFSSLRSSQVISDLLDPSAKKKNQGLDVKEHPVLGVYVKGLQEIVTDNSVKMQKLIDQGMGNRHVAATQMNAESSRSHSVFTIKIHQKDKTDDSKSIFAKVNLVDLAGSERAKSTGASGATLKEGANINKSLSALGNVINALVEQAKGKKKVFVPYRNSKLTRVLQESLGGNSLTAMLAALSPAAVNHDETLSTLKYAARAKSIKLSAKKNEEASQISQLEDEIALLKKKLAEQAAGGGEGMVAGGAAALDVFAAGGDPEQEARYQNQIKELEDAMKDTWEQKEKVSQQKEVERQGLIKEQATALQRAQDEREKRWQMLEEKNDVELSVRNACDTAQNLPSSEWMTKVRHMLALEQETKEEMTVTTVYRNAFTTDAALVSIVRGDATVPIAASPGKDASNGSLLGPSSNTAVNAAAIKQVLSKLHHLQSTSSSLMNAQNELISFTSGFVREVRAACEQWEQAPAVEEVVNDGTQMSEENIQKKKAAAEDAQLREDAARGLRMVLRQLNKKRAEMSEVVCDEREKLFDMLGVAKDLFSVLEVEIDKTEGRKGDDDIDAADIDAQITFLTTAKDDLGKFLDANSKVTKTPAVESLDQPAAVEDEVTESDIKAAKPLGVSTGRILNKQITSSNDSSSASSARLNITSKDGGWVGSGSPGDYLQIDLKRKAVITSVYVQGRYIPPPQAPGKVMVTKTIKKKVRMKKEGVQAMAVPPVVEPPAPSPEGPALLNNVGVGGINDDMVQTKEMLAEIISWPTLLKSTPPEKLLGRPPVRFLFDLIGLIRKTTGFGDGESWSQSEWGSLKSKGDKIGFMDSVIKCAVEVSGFNGDMPAKGSDILRGIESGNTNKMLQILGLAAKGGGKSGASSGGGGTTLAAAAPVADEYEEIEIEEAVTVEEDAPPTEKVQPQYTKKLTISTSNDGTAWVNYPETLIGQNKTTSISLLKPIPSARYVRFIPLEWSGSAQSLRVEIGGIFKDEQGAMSSPRASDRSALAEEGFVLSVNGLLSHLQSSLAALMKKAERTEAEERLKVQKRGTALASQKEALEEELHKKEDENEQLASQIAELLEKLNELQLGSVKLQAQKEKDEMTISKLTETCSAHEGALKEKEQACVSLVEEKDSAVEDARDAKEQLEVVTDERNIAREKEEQLFEKLADTNLELESIQESYVYMTERSNNYQDEIMELQEQVEGYKEMVKKQVQAQVQAPIVLKSAPTVVVEREKVVIPEPLDISSALNRKTEPMPDILPVGAFMGFEAGAEDDIGAQNPETESSPSKSLTDLDSAPPLSIPQSSNSPQPFSGQGGEEEEEGGGGKKKENKLTKQQEEILAERKKIKEQMAANKAGGGGFKKISEVKMPTLGGAASMPSIGVGGRGGGGYTVSSDDDSYVNYDDDYDDDFEDDFETFSGPGKRGGGSARPKSANRGGARARGGGGFTGL